MYQIMQRGGTTITIGESRIVAGTLNVHAELQAIRSLIADFFRMQTGRPAPSGRQLGGMVGYIGLPAPAVAYAATGQTIQATPQGQAMGAAHRKGVDTEFRYMPAGSYVMRKDAYEKHYQNKQQGGQLYAQEGNLVPVMVQPGEGYFSPEAVKSIGIGKLTAQNADYKQNGGLIYANNGRRIDGNSQRFFPKLPRNAENWSGLTRQKMLQSGKDLPRGKGFTPVWTRMTDGDKLSHGGESNEFDRRTEIDRERRTEITRDESGSSYAEKTDRNKRAVEERIKRISYAERGIFMDVRDRRFQGVSELITDPYKEIFGFYGVPEEHNRIQISGRSLPPDMAAAARWNKQDNVGELYFNQDIDAPDQQRGDDAIHEAAHIIAKLKALKYRQNPEVMPLVPMDKFYGMGEAFGEFLSMDVSPKYFPGRAKQPIPPRILVQYARMFGMSLADMLLVDDPHSSIQTKIANDYAPSILYHARKREKYEDIVHAHNNFARPYVPEKGLRTQFAESVNDTFRPELLELLRRQKGGQVPDNSQTKKNFGIEGFQQGGIVHPKYYGLGNLVASNEKLQPILNDEKSTIRKAYKQAQESGKNVVYIKRREGRDQVTFDFANNTGTYTGGWTGHPADTGNAIGFSFDDIIARQQGGIVRPKYAAGGGMLGGMEMASLMAGIKDISKGIGGQIQFKFNGKLCTWDPQYGIQTGTYNDIAAGLTKMGGSGFTQDQVTNYLASYLPYQAKDKQTVKSNPYEISPFDDISDITDEIDFVDDSVIEKQWDDWQKIKNAIHANPAITQYLPHKDIVPYEGSVESLSRVSEYANPFQSLEHCNTTRKFFVSGYRMDQFSDCPLPTVV